LVPVVAVNASARWQAHELRLTTVPPDSDTDFILNLSYTNNF